MSKNTIRWITTRLSFITAVFVTLFILGGWLLQPIEAAPAARPVAQGQVAGPGMYDDYDSVFRYTGHWQAGNFYSNAYKTTMHFTTDATARAALTFQGTGFILYRVTYTNRGLMDVYIDGALYASPNNFSDTAIWQAPLVINGLPDAVHTVQFANTSPTLYMDIDAVRVLEGSALPPVSTATAHPVTATVFVPPTDLPVGALPNLSANLSQPLIPQAITITPSPTASHVPNSVSAASGIITPIPTYKALIYGGQQSVPPNNLFTVNPIVGDSSVQVSNTATTPGFNYPVWSPDGKSVAFSDASSQLQILTIATGTYVAPSTVPITISSPVAWDPTGAKRIAYIDAGSGNALKAVDFSGSTATITQLIATTGTGTGYSQVSWNKTANLITFQAAGTSTNSLIDSISAACIPSGICTANSALDPGANGAISSDPAWSPNQTKLAYVSNRDGQTLGHNDVYVFDPALNTTTRLTNSPTTSKHSPAWNIAGTQLVYVDSQTVINLVDNANTASPAAPVTITNATAGTLLSVSWSPLYVGPPTATPDPTQTSTPSATPVTLTGGSLTADNLTPLVGAPVTFTFTVTNTTNFNFSSVSALLQVNGTTMVPLSGLSGATPTSMAPGAQAVFKFTYFTNSSDTCNLSPIASFSGVLPPIGGVSPPPATLVLSQLTSGGAINEQRIGLTTGGILPSSGTTAVGQTLTTTVNVTNSGCLSEIITGNTLVNNTRTGDAVTSGGQTTLSLPPGNSATFTSTHTVTSTDISLIALANPADSGLAMVSLSKRDRANYTESNGARASALRAVNGVVVSYTFNVSASTTTGVPLTTTIITSSSSYTISSASVTGTPSALALVKKASVSSVSPGGAFSYTITVTNHTGVLISSLLISDSLPTSVTPGTVTVSPNTCPSTITNGSLTVTCSSLADTQSVIVTIPVTVLKSIGTGTSISNTANASYSGGNATPGTVSVAVANGASSLPVTGYVSDYATPVGLTVLAMLIGSLAVVGARRHLAQRR